jgi:hypothetical protein
LEIFLPLRARVAHHLRQGQGGVQNVSFLVGVLALALPRSWEFSILMIDRFWPFSVNLFVVFFSFRWAAIFTFSV